MLGSLAYWHRSRLNMRMTTRLLLVILPLIRLCARTHIHTSIHPHTRKRTGETESSPRAKQTPTSSSLTTSTPVPPETGPPPRRAAGPEVPVELRRVPDAQDRVPAVRGAFLLRVRGPGERGGGREMGPVLEAGGAWAPLLQPLRRRMSGCRTIHQDLLSRRQNRDQNQGISP